MKIVTIIGARPQFVKAAMVSRAIQRFNQASGEGGLNQRIVEILVHTGQHYDYMMDRVFFEELDMPDPCHHLGAGSGSHGVQTGTMLERLEPVLAKEKPGAVLVYGDTNSTLAGALAAAKMHIPVAHVEAGLRSYDRRMPEEINRVLTDHLSTVLFCPTEEAVLNLAGEGIRHGKGDRWVKQVGDVMHDAILFYSRIADQKSTLLQEMGIAAGDGRRKRDFYLATIHRAENTDDPERLKSILRALDEIGKKVPVVLPLHPRTRKRMEALHLDPGRGNVVILEPVSYLNMLKLEKDARAILTDSGGIQKEAYWLRVPCVTLREVTEWGYTVESGWNTLAGWKTRDILRAVRDLSRSEGKKEKVPREKPASDKIVRILYDRIRQKGNRGRKSRLS